MSGDIERIMEKPLSWYDDERMLAPHSVHNYPVVQVSKNRWLVSANVYGPPTWVKPDGEWVSIDDYESHAVGIWLTDNNLEVIDIWKWEVFPFQGEQVGDFRPWVNRHHFFEWSDGRALLYTDDIFDLPWAYSGQPACPTFRLVWVEGDAIQVGPSTSHTDLFGEGRLTNFSPGVDSKGLLYISELWHRESGAYTDAFFGLSHDGMNISIDHVSNSGPNKNESRWSMGMVHVQDDIHLVGITLEDGHSNWIPGTYLFFWLRKENGTILDEVTVGGLEDGEWTHLYYYDWSGTYDVGNMLWRVSDTRFSVPIWRRFPSLPAPNKYKPSTALLEVDVDTMTFTSSESIDHLDEPIDWNSGPWRMIGTDLIALPGGGAVFPVSAYNYMPYGNDGLPVDTASEDAIVSLLPHRWKEEPYISTHTHDEAVSENNQDIGPRTFIGNRVLIASGGSWSRGHAILAMFQIGEFWWSSATDYLGNTYFLSYFGHFPLVKADAPPHIESPWSDFLFLGDDSSEFTVRGDTPGKLFATPRGLVWVMDKKARDRYGHDSIYLIDYDHATVKESWVLPRRAALGGYPSHKIEVRFHVLYYVYVPEWEDPEVVRDIYAFDMSTGKDLGVAFSLPESASGDGYIQDWTVRHEDRQIFTLLKNYRP